MITDTCGRAVVAARVSGSSTFDDPVAAVGDAGEADCVAAFTAVNAACNRHHALTRQVGLRQTCHRHGCCGTSFGVAFHIVDTLVDLVAHVHHVIAKVGHALVNRLISLIQLAAVDGIGAACGDGAVGRPKHVALIGKGITFDSGGLSLKPAASMPEMKSDMAGAATVLGAVISAARLALPIRVTAWLALAENMPGADAQRPSDVVTMFDGTTVEVTNTDAEGRLVMADALARAVTEEPDAVLDVATLTGAQIVALGDHVAAVMGTPDLREEVVAAAQRAGESFWPMPLPAHLRATLDSPFADLRNAKIGSRAGGMLSAGLFLREFVGRRPWAHLDIAGPAYNDSAPWGLTPTGGTGMGVSTLVELLRSLSAEVSILS